LKVINMPGGLCRSCYGDPAIRVLHPAFRPPRPRLRQTSAHELFWRARNAGQLIRGDCPHGRPDGECPACEKAQRAGLVMAGEEDESCRMPLSSHLSARLTNLVEREYLESKSDLVLIFLEGKAAVSLGEILVAFPEAEEADVKVAVQALVQAGKVVLRDRLYSLA